MNSSYGLISWLVIGTLAGWLGSKIMGTDGRQDWLANVIIGIAGAVVGGYLARVFLGNNASGDNGVLMSLLVALGGACLVIFAWTTVSRRRA
jgi:uncharacterized membrane protein YeaQ/YmgE (transglycosylase-associated protein family)